MDSTPEDTRRKGDTRPSEDDEAVSLTFLPAHGKPFRWLPKHGSPLCVGEWLTQHGYKCITWAPLYTAVVVTISVLFQIFGIPFIGDK